MRIFSTLIFSLLITFSSIAQNRYEGCAENLEIAPSEDLNDEQTLFHKLNQVREDSGLAPLKRNPYMDMAARYHANDMMIDDYFSHKTRDRDGSNNLVDQCNQNIRMAAFFDFDDTRENLALGWNNQLDSVIYAANQLGWMTSGVHREAILNPNMREMGIGNAFGYTTFMGANYDAMFRCVDFRIKNDVYPVLINQDSLSTVTQSVRLYIYGNGVFTDMRIKNEGEAWSSTMPFNSNVNWTLSAGNGLKTVYVELTDGTTTIVSKDQICVGTSCSHPPIARDDEESVNVGGTAIINVTTNDYDPEFDALTTAIISGPALGNANTGGGVLEYAAPSSGTIDSLDYSVCDNSGNCDTATLYITLNPTSIETVNENFKLIRPFPNPFTNQSQLSVQVNETQMLEISLHNILGQKIQVPFNGLVKAGQKTTITLDGSQLEKGLYLYQIKGENFKTSGKVVLK